MYDNNYKRPEKRDDNYAKLIEEYKIAALKDFMVKKEVYPGFFPR
jgi:hypothetical protein